MKKILFTLLSIFAFAGVYAEEQTALILQLNDGTTNTFFLSDKPLVTMPGDSVSVVSNHVNVSYDRKEVKKFYFTQADPDGIGQIIEDSFVFNFSDDNTIYVQGLKENTSVFITSLDGKNTAQLKCDASGNITILMSDYPDGVYVITIGNKKIKIKK